MTDFARENVHQEVLDADYLKDVDADFGHDKKKVPFKKAGALLAEQLVEDGYMTASEYVPEETVETVEDETAESDVEASEQVESVVEETASA